MKAGIEFERELNVSRRGVSEAETAVFESFELPAHGLYQLKMTTGWVPFNEADSVICVASRSVLSQMRVSMGLHNLSVCCDEF